MNQFVGEWLVVDNDSFHQPSPHFKNKIMKNIVIVLINIFFFINLGMSQEDVRYRVRIDASELIYEKNEVAEEGKTNVRLELIGEEGSVLKGKLMEGSFRPISFTKEYIGDIVAINLTLGGVYWTRRVDIDEIEISVSSDEWDEPKKYEFPCGCTLTQGNSTVSLDEGGALDFEADLAAIADEDARTNKIELDGEFVSDDVSGDGFTISKRRQKTMTKELEEIKKETEENRICTTKEYTASASFSTSFLTNASISTIYPGALVTAESMASGEYTTIPAKRKPITISTSIASIGSPMIEVDNPKLSTTRAAMNELMKERGEIQVQANFTIKEVHSREQLSVALGGHFAYAGAELNVDFTYNSEEEETLKVVKFAQIYYTMDMDQPDSPFDVFQNEEDALKVLKMDGTPLYISTVTYGRMAYFFMKTSMSTSEIKAHMDAAMTTATGDGSTYADAEEHNLLEQTEISALIIGGDNDAGITAVDGYEGFLDMLRDGGSFSAGSVGVPISYVCKYLADNSVARVNLTTNYVKRECRTVAATHEKAVVSLEQIKMLLCDDSDDNTELYSYGFSVDLYNGNDYIKKIYFNGASKKSWKVNAGEFKSIGEAGKPFEYLIKELDNLTLRVTSFYVDYDDVGSNDTINGAKNFRLADLVGKASGAQNPSIIVENDGDKGEFVFNVKLLK